MKRGVVIGVVAVTSTCGCCDSTPAWSWECESLSGTATLKGVTGYKPAGDTHTEFDPEAPWQYRKWAARRLAGSYTQTSYFGFIPGCVKCQQILTFEYSGTHYFDGVGVSDDKEDRYEAYATLTDDCGALTFISTSTEPERLSILVLTRSYLDPVSYCPRPAGGDFVVTASYTLTTATAYICPGQETCYADRSQTTTATEELLEEVYFYDALAATGTAVAGESCCASLTAATLLSPESTDDLTMSGTDRRIKMNLGGEGIWSFRFTLEQANDFPAPPDVTEIDLVFTVSPSAPSPQYYNPQLPIPGDYGICVTNVELLGYVPA